MEIIINGKQAVLKKNTSFEFISENSLFTGSDSYTLAITFPLKDCPQNISIFGHINRQDVDKAKVLFDCEIRDKAFYKAGSIIITNISEVEVKTQFLEGRSEQNFDDSFDDIYLNQLSLGYPEASQRNPAVVDYYTACHNNYPNVNWVALPWVNNTSGNLQNAVTIDDNGDYAWASNLKVLTYQPFLLYILQKICEVIGYAGNFNAIRSSKYAALLICNTLPGAWNPWNFALALPHWSLTEFFEELEKLLGGEFTINHKAKTIGFEFSHVTAYQTAPVSLDKIINKYTVEVSQENRSEYVGAMNKAYAENDNRMWAYRSCEWYIRDHQDEAVVYETLAELLQYAETLKECGYTTWSSGGHQGGSYTRGYPSNSNGHKLFYARDVDTYFIMWCYKAEYLTTFHSEILGADFNYYKYTNRLEPVNQFGKRMVDKEADDVEINIVPAWIDDTDETMGRCLFLECGQMDSAVSWTEETDGEGNTTAGTATGTGTSSGGHHYGGIGGSSEGAESLEYDETDYNNGALAQTKTGRAIANGEQDKSDAYFDKIYVAYWDGYNRQAGKLARPIVDYIMLMDDFTVSHTSYSLRINKSDERDGQGIPLKYTHEIDNKKKYNFSFLSDVIPDPRALFFIEGRKYICEKITATFHEETGKSQLLKGVFYRVIGE